MKKSSTSEAGSPATQITLQASMEKCQEYDKKGKKWNELTDAVTYYIGKEALPIRTVEKPGFKKMLKKFDARYQLTSQKYFSQKALPILSKIK